MSDDFLALFSNATDIIRLEPGQVLFDKGETGSQMYVVKSGEVTIGDGNHVFERLSMGGIVGEMALMDKGPRSATVRAVTEAEVIPIDQRRFLFMVQQTPFFAIRVMRVMSARLRAMNERITALP
jgi:CRP-like cAMP-binding protein